MYHSCPPFIASTVRLPAKNWDAPNLVVPNTSRLPPVLLKYQPMGIPINIEPSPASERLAYSIQESADLLGVHYFSVYRLIQRGKLKACRALRGKLLVPRSELLRVLKGE